MLAKLEFYFALATNCIPRDHLLFCCSGFAAAAVAVKNFFLLGNQSGFWLASRK